MSFVSRNHPQQVAKRGPDHDTDDRRTPDDLLRECLDLAEQTHADLDVAASAENAKAPRFYDIERDGLTQPWDADVVWCNPPYSNLGSWMMKALLERPRYRRAILLLPANRTEQVWWQDLVEPQRRAGHLTTHFLAGRRRFDRPGWTKPAKGDRPPFGLCVVVVKGWAP